jgi:hypothetical protein
MNTEVWKQIENHPNYSISNFGNIRNDNTGKKLSKVLNNGYYAFSFCYSKTNRKTIRLHRLVAMAFISNLNNLPNINHIDGCKTNNHYSNLEWVNQDDNVKHSVKTGLHKVKRGSQSGMGKLTENDVKIIRERLSNGDKCIDIAKDFSTTTGAIYGIKKGQSWGWLV